MIIEMTQDGDGAWKYHDNTQAELCTTVMALTGWEITGFDDWINTDAHWKNSEFEGKKNRDELIELRHRLTRTFHDYNHDNYVIELEAQRLFAVAQWIASHVAGYKIARKEQLHSVAQAARNASNAARPRPDARAVDHEDVLNEYRRLVQVGHTEREARGILVQRGNMGSQATIYRVTKEK